MNEFPKKQVKVLSITSSPDSSVMYEMEQSVLLEAFSGFGGEDLVLDMPDPVSSTMIELDKYLGEYSYDILIISAHGSKDGKLLFEDEEGDDVRVTGREIAEKVQKLSPLHRPSIIILSACHSARKDDDSGQITPAQELLDAGVTPCIIGMKQAISQLAAIDFNRGFIGAILGGSNFKEACEVGAEAIKEGENKRLQDRGKEWKFINEDRIPHIFFKEDSEVISRSQFHDVVIEREKLVSADFAGAKHVERGFIGRREELRLIMNKVFTEKVSRIVVKGPGGVGKSALTTRVCANLKNEGWELIIFVGSISISEVLKKIFNVAKNQGIEGALEILESPDIKWQKKLSYIIKEFLSKKKVAIIFDNFEDNQDEETGQVNTDLEEFITICNELRNHDSVLFITTRYMIPGLDEHIELKDLNAIEAQKMFFHFKALSRLKMSEVPVIYQKIGANPRVLELLEALSFEEFGNNEFNVTSLEDVISEAIKTVTGDEDEGKGFAPWFIGRLISYLNDKEKEMLKRVSLYRLPVRSDGLFLEWETICTTKKRLCSLSLIVDMAEDTYFAHRLTSEHVVTHMYEKEELKRQRKKAGEYLEDVNPFEAIYQYTEAAEPDRAFEIANTVQGHLIDHGYVYEARYLLESFSGQSAYEKKQRHPMLLHWNNRTNAG